MINNKRMRDIMTEKEKHELKLISVIFISILVTFLLSICVWLDVGNNNNESITNIFLTGLNVLVMSILTYLLLETSRKSNETNELLTKHTIHTFNFDQIKTLNYENDILRGFLHDSIQLNRIFIEYLSYDDKEDVIINIISSQIANGKYIYVYDEAEVKRKIFNGEKIDIEKYYDKNNVIKQKYTIKDIKELWEKLKRIESDYYIKLGASFRIMMSKKIKEIDDNITLLESNYDKDISLINIDMEEKRAKDIFTNINYLNYVIEEQVKNNYEAIDKYSTYLYF